MADVVGILVYVEGPTESAVVARLDGVEQLRVERRCADLAELLGAARAGVGTLAVLSLGRGVDRPLVAELARLGLRTVLVAAPEDLHRAGALGAGRVVPDGRAVAADVEFAVLELSAAAAAAAAPAAPAASASPTRPAGARATRARPADHDAALPPAADAPLAARRQEAAEPAAPAPDPDDAPAPTRVIAVWSAAGSTGRSTVASALAAEIARSGVGVVLVDADTVAPGLVQLLGVLEEGAALPALCRAAGAGTLDPSTLARRLVRVEPGLEFVSGLTRADRWREVDADSLRVVIEALRGRARVVVVDLGGGLEPQPPRGGDRWAATRTVLAEADDVVLLAPPDPVGVRRLVGLVEGEIPGSAARHVVLAQTRPVARASVGDARDALARFASLAVVAEIPYDDAVPAALLAGRSVPAHAPRSAVRAAVRELAAHLLPDLPERAQRARTARGLTHWLRAPLRPSHDR